MRHPSCRHGADVACIRCMYDAGPGARHARGAALGCEPRNFLQPCLLLLLREQPDHGYGLVERLRPLNAVDGNAGRVYRLLRSLEQAGLVRSDWLSSESGPPRRVYHLTRTGAGALDEWAEALKENRRALEVYLDRHAAATAQPVV